MPKMMTCPNCGSDKLVDAFHQTAVPVHSVVLFQEASAAKNIKRGEICLSICQDCSFGFNRTFDDNLIDYFQSYESTQAYSDTFNKFHHKLADDLIQKYDLDGKHIIEIGCGQGEFLEILSSKCNITALGFDPAYYGEKHLPDGALKGESAQIANTVCFIKDYYSEKYSDYVTDVLICKMTLEHISQTSTFVKNIRTALQKNPHSKVFFQIPNASRIYSTMAFWDVYYEHCSYFNKQSLVALFEQHHFQVDHCYVDYDDQYLMIEARPVSNEIKSEPFLATKSMDGAVETKVFSETVQDKILFWQDQLSKIISDGGVPVLWGGGSKAVSFLTALGHPAGLDYAVDINPKKFDTFLPGGGQKVISPDTLKKINPSHVIIMNGVYRAEITAEISKMGLSPVISTLDN